MSRQSSATSYAPRCDLAGNDSIATPKQYDMDPCGPRVTSCDRRVGHDSPWGTCSSGQTFRSSLEEVRTLVSLWWWSVTVRCTVSISCDRCSCDRLFQLHAFVSFSLSLSLASEGLGRLPGGVKTRANCLYLDDGWWSLIHRDLYAPYMDPILGWMSSHI